MLNHLLASLIIVSSQFVVGVSAADAQVSKAFKIMGQGVAPTGIPLPGDPPRFHNVKGNATHLGLHLGMGSVETISADFSQFPVITGVFRSGSPFEFTGANGSQLVCDYGRDADGNSVGKFELVVLDIDANGNMLVQATWLADFVARGDLSTGKFDGVSGSWTMLAKSAPFILGSNTPAAYGWEGKGRLTFQK
jgi:hypothetical protein